MKGVKVDVFTQKVEFKRTKTTNLATGEVTYGAWNQAEGLWIAFDAPVYDNYETDTIKVNNKTVTPDTANETARIDYTAKRENLTEEKVVKRVINIYKDGQKVDQHVQSVTFKRTNIKNLATGEITYGEWDEPSKMLDDYRGPEFENYDSPSNRYVPRTAVSATTEDLEVNMYYTAKVATSIEQKTVVRTIQLHFPDGTFKKVTQQVTFKREVKTNLATGEKEYGAWDMDKNTLPEYKVDQVENYEPSQSVVEAVVVTPETETLTVDIYYNAKTATEVEEKVALRQILLHLPDGTVKEVTQQVTFKREVKTNLATGEKEYGAWDIEEGTLPEYQVDQVENYEPSQSVAEAMVVTPETAGNWTVDIYYNAKTATEVEERVALRQILLHLPDGTVKEVTQQVMFKREIKTNLATGEKEYGAWDIEEGTLPEYQVEQVENYEPSQSVVEAMKVTPETAGNWTVDIYYNAKTTTRTEYYTAKRVISLVKDGKKVDEITQSVLFKREVTKNLATGEETFSDWSTDNDSWEAFVAPSFENYVANIPQLEAVKVDPNTKDTEVTINYTAATKEVQETRTVKRVINIYRDGKKVDEITQRVVFTRTNIVNLATGEITYGAWNEDQKHFAEYEVPEVYGYEPEEKIISAMAVDPEMQDTTANVNYKSIVTTEIEEKVVDRKIILNLPNGMTREHIQSVTFKREVYKNLATGEMTYGAWDIPQAMFEAYQVPGFSGYVASVKHIEALEVTADSESTTVVVDYYQQSKEEKDVFRIFNIQVIDGVLPRGKQQYTQKVTFTRDVYLDANGKVVGHGDWEQTELMFEDFEIPQREGYATFRSVIAGQKVTVDSADLESEITYVAHANDTETKEVKRKVTIILPNGSKHEEIQTVTFVRDKVTNQISGKTSYGNWLPATENSEFPEMVLPDIAGYKPSQTVDRLDVTSDMANIEVTVTYERDGDAGETTPDAPGNGEVTPDVPGNGEITPDAPDAGETTPDAPGNGEVTPDVPGNGETTPDAPNAGETTPDVPGNGEATPDIPDAGETTPDTPGDGEVTPDTPDAGETTPDTPENGETPSGTPEAGADSDSDDTDQSDLGMKPEIGPGQNSPSKMKNNGSGAKVPNMANSSADKATKNNAAAGTELPNLGDETIGLKGLGALLAAMACASLFMSATAKKRKN
ncbi:mucin-binding protein [Ligilactobacillus animalis]